MITTLIAVILAVLAGLLSVRVYSTTLDLLAKRSDLTSVSSDMMIKVLKGTGYLVVRRLGDQRPKLYRIVAIPDRTTITVRKAGWLERLAFLPRKERR